MKACSGTEGQERWLRRGHLGVIYNSLDERRQSHFFEVVLLYEVQPAIPRDTWTRAHTHTHTHTHVHTHMYTHTCTHTLTLSVSVFTSTFEPTVCVLFWVAVA